MVQGREASRDLLLDAEQRHRVVQRTQRQVDTEKGRHTVQRVFLPLLPFAYVATLVAQDQPDFSGQWVLASTAFRVPTSLSLSPLSRQSRGQTPSAHRWSL